MSVAEGSISLFSLHSSLDQRSATLVLVRARLLLVLVSAQPLDDTAFASGEGVTLYPPEGADAYQAQGAAVGAEEGGARAALGGAGAADADDDGADGRGVVAGYDERGVWVDPSEPQWMASDSRRCCFYMPACPEGDVMPALRSR